MSAQLYLFCACALGLVMADFEPYKPEHAMDHFERFIEVHERSYVREDEKQARFQIFHDNLKKANELNQKSGRAIFGITPFSDLTQREFAEKYTGLKIPASGDLDGYCPFVHDGDIEIDAPDSFDWRDKGIVSPVKSQLTCGSCYAFSAIGNIESQYAIKYGQKLLLSEQQIVDCDMNNDGCCGGWTHVVFKNLMKHGGPMYKEDYPYVGTVQKCSYNENLVPVRVTGCHSYNFTCQDHLKRALVKFGPISIALQSTNLQLYSGEGGIIDDQVCDVGKINHAALLVGYGEENGKPYWIVKNSWGDRWGEGGYFRIQRGPHALSCGMMNQFMTSSIVEKNNH